MAELTDRFERALTYAAQVHAGELPAELDRVLAALDRVLVGVPRPGERLAQYRHASVRLSCAISR